MSPSQIKGLVRASSDRSRQRNNSSANTHSPRTPPKLSSYPHPATRKVWTVDCGAVETVQDVCRMHTEEAE
ncbi:Hypothetical protein SMAX5B_012781 [Scophthalmus maximus]|uniref:Uncharacterized protein n=1 Tax=Scophthalmus maximus TaxID=52904 RepID=A0A2U9BX03_SCOMX|nr:Hypothetical protein SMAX5B_012781 [Scophthalmus maximus]